MYDRLLIPVDGSDATRAVADIGIELAAISDADVHILHVLKTNFPLDSHSEQLEKKQKEEAGAVVDEMAEAVSATGFDTTTAVRQGVPHREILSYATAQSIDIIVMGTHGRTGVDRVVHRSTTEKVVRLSDTQVLAAHPFEDDRPVAHSGSE